MISGIITALLALVITGLILENIGAIIIWAIIIFLILGGLVWLIVELTPTRYYTKNCPWGYHHYGCQPDCPMHEHCWGSNPLKDNTTNRNRDYSSNNTSNQSFLPDTPKFRNEDNDWRTTYMDDTSYDDREYDERHDDDRFDNGGW